MKKTVLIALAGVGLLFASNISATDEDDVKSLYSAIGFDKGASTIETDYTSFQDDLNKITPDESKLADIFDVADFPKYAFKKGDDPAAGIANLQYIQQLTNMNAMIRALEKNLKAVKAKLDGYTTNANTKKVLQAIYDDYSDVHDLLVAKTAKNYAGIYSAQKAANEKGGVDATITRLEAKLVTDKTAIETDFKAIPKADRDTALDKIKDLYADLKVDKPDYEASDVTPLLTCDKEADEEGCNTKAKQFMSSMFGKGKQPRFMDVQTEFANDCMYDQLSKQLGTIFKAGQIFCASQVMKAGMVNADGSPNKNSLSCLSAYKAFGKDNSDMITKYINRLDNASTLNLAMLTSGTGNTSLGMAAFYPTNVLKNAGTGSTTTNTNTNTSPTTTTTTTNLAAANIGSISNTGDGVSRYNTSQALSFYGGASSTYNDMSKDAKTLISTYKPVSNTYQRFNSDLSSAIIASNPNVVKIANTEKTWAASTTAKVSTLNQQQQSDYLRLQFSQQQATVNAIVAQMDIAQRNLGMANFMALYGSEKEATKAAYDSANYELNLKMLAIEGTAASSRLGLLMGSLGLGSTPYYNKYFNYTLLENIHYMYAANDNRNMPRALKLENLKTPINLKKGWEKDFQAYIDQMSARSEEARKEMEQAKEKIRKFIAQKLPVVPFNKLPQPGEIRDELLNMQSLRKASLKNIDIINKAMAYHDGRKNAYPADKYTTFKNEHDSMTGAMKRTISSIETAEQPVSEARELIKGLYKEVPRAEALKIIAKQMVEEGR